MHATHNYYSVSLGHRLTIQTTQF